MASVFGPPASELSLPGPPRIAFLIGPTGQGKSTCGSYLIDPEESVKNPAFERAIGMKPMTLGLNSAQVHLRGLGSNGSGSTVIELVDTPGLDEGSTADLKHMVEVFTELKEAGFISAIILCVKLDRKLDQPFKVLLDFWRRLFKDVLRTNFFVIMSNVKMDSASIEEREDDHFDVDKAEATLQQELRSYFHADSQTFTIIRMDGRPHGKEAKQISEASRRNVLRKIASLPQVDVSQMNFAKLPEMLKEDEALKKEVDGKITGYIDYQRKLGESLGVSAKRLQGVESELQQETQTRTKAKEELANLSVIKEVNVGTVNETKSWTVGWDPHKKKFRLTSKFPISRIAVDCGDTVSLTPSKLVAICDDGLFVVEGEAKGGWVVGVVRHFYLNIAAYCLGSTYYGEQISSLNAMIHQHDQSIGRLELRKLEILDRNSSDQKELSKTQAYIDEFRVRAEDLGRDSMKLDKAIERLEDMVKKEAAAAEAAKARARERASAGSRMTGTAVDISFSGLALDAGTTVQVPS